MVYSANFYHLQTPDKISLAVSIVNNHTNSIIPNMYIYQAMKMNLIHILIDEETNHLKCNNLLKSLVIWMVI